MEIAVAFLSVLLLLACLSHLFVDVLGIKMIRTLPILGRLAPAAPEKWPRVSLIVSACNEADTLREAMAAKLAEDYPNLELVLVQDRSTDDTPAIADEIAASDARVRAIHVRELPAGWLGKLHAMQRGLEAASGEWILFSDADVHLAPGTIRRAIALCLERGHDLLAAVPDLAPSGDVLLEAVYTSAIRSTSVGYQARKMEDPRSRAAAGSGAFTLVRRAALDRTAGLEWLKLEVADDVSLAQMVKREGGRTGLVSGLGTVKVAWYRSMAELAVGWEKNGFAVLSGYRIVPHVIGCVLLMFSAFAPLLAAAGFGWGWLQPVGAATLGLDIGVAAVLNLWWRREVWPALLLPIGDFLATWFLLRSGLLAVARGGILWRGTLYPLDELRKNRRFKMPI